MKKSKYQKKIIVKKKKNEFSYFSPKTIPPPPHREYRQGRVKNLDLVRRKSFTLHLSSPTQVKKLFHPPPHRE